jgi:hypothetical protein
MTKWVTCKGSDGSPVCSPPKSTAPSGSGAPTENRPTIGKKKRFKVLRACGFRCRYCGCSSTEVRLGIDHVVPVIRGGTDDESNLVAACFDCNIGKGVLAVDLSGTDFLSWLLRQSERNDWVGDLAQEEIAKPSLREPKNFRDLAAQIRAEETVEVEGKIRAAWHAWREYRHRGGRPTLLMRKLQEPFAPIGIEIVAAEVGARLLRVADAQLRQWATKVSPPIWEGLYVWLTSLGFKNSEGLHNRTYVGDILMDRLCDAERERLRMRKIRGEKLDNAVAWSNIGSGPLEGWISRKLTGDALMVFDDRESALRAQNQFLANRR